MCWVRVENIDLWRQDIAILWEIQEIWRKTQKTRRKVLEAAGEEFNNGRGKLVNRGKIIRIEEHSQWTWR